MKNKWLYLASKCDYKQTLNNWFQSIWKGNPNSLGNALYDLINLVYSECKDKFIPRYDKEDVVQECILEILNESDNLKEDESISLSLCQIIEETINKQSSGFFLTENEKDNLLKKFHSKIKNYGA